MSENNRSFIQALILTIAPTFLAGFAAWKSDEANETSSLVKKRQNIIQERIDENSLINKSNGSTIPVGFDQHWSSYSVCRNQNIENSRKECSGRIIAQLPRLTNDLVADPIWGKSL